MSAIRTASNPSTYTYDGNDEQVKSVKSPRGHYRKRKIKHAKTAPNNKW